MMEARLPRWLRLTLVLALILAAGAAGLFGYRYFTRPVTLTLAVGSFDGAGVKLMTALATQLASSKSKIRLKVEDVSTATEAAKRFSEGKADLAVVRADASGLENARTIILATNLVALIVVPPGSKIEDIDGLKGKTIGVVGGEVNRRVAQALTQEYDPAKLKLQFKDLAFADVRKAVEAKQVSALLMVTPITPEYLALVRGAFPAKGKDGPGLVAIESAGAIAEVAKAYESYELPKGTLRGSPPIPDEDLTTLRIPVFLVANKKLDDGVAADLIKAIMDSRRSLLAENPIMAQVAAPETEKDAFIPIHPGAAAYLDGTQKDFFDKYGNALFYGPMALGLLASLATGMWQFLGGSPDEKKPANPLDPLYALARRVRAAQSEEELNTIEEEIDAILQAELAKHATEDSDPMTAAALSLAVQRLDHLIDVRRRALENGAARPAAA